MGKNILIIRLSAIGDVAMTVPVVYSLAHSYPDVHISVLSRPYARPFFDSIADNVEFIEADLKGRHAGFRGLNKLYAQLRNNKFTAVADMHNVMRTWFLRLRFGIDAVKTAAIDKHRKEKWQLTRKRGKKMNEVPSSFDNYMEVLRKLGFDFKIEFNSLFEGKNIDYSLIDTLIGEKNEKWIGIAPFATHEGKIYPLQRMKKAIDEIIAQHPTARIFLFGGGKAEMEVMNQWQQEMPNVINASQLLGGIRNELLLMSKLDVMLSMDSANAHIASLVGTKVVSIWGATHPLAGFKSWNINNENIIQRNLPCRPCSVYGNKKCMRGDYECLNIDEKEIVKVINREIGATV